MRSQDLITFIKIAEIGSIQTAANAVGLTQSAASRVVQRLEEQLGTTLFDRKSKPLELTRDGAMALRHAQKIVAATEDFMNAFHTAGTPSGSLRIGLAHAIAPILLREPALQSLSDYPKVSLIYRTDWTRALIERVRSHDLDLALILLGSEEIPPSDLLATPIATSMVSVLAHSTHAQLPQSLAELNKIGWALNPEGCGYRLQLSTVLQRSGDTPNVRFEVNSLELQLQIAQSGQALTLVPTALVRGMLERYDLVSLPVTDFTFGVTVTQTQHKHETRYAPVAASIARIMRHTLS